MIRFLLLVLVISLVVNAAPTREELEAVHIKMIMQEKNFSLLNGGEFNYVAQASEIIINGEKVVKVVEYSICKKDNLISIYTEKDNHGIYMLSFTKQNFENSSVLTTCKVIKNQVTTGQLDIELSYTKGKGFSFNTTQKISSKETAMIDLCAKEYQEKELNQVRNISGNMLPITDYILPRIYGNVIDCKFENLTSEVLHKTLGKDEKSSRYASRCLGAHSSYANLICMLGSINDLNQCVAKCRACGCHTAYWYSFYIYNCLVTCQ